MGTIFSTVLITAPLAFIAGWLVSKVLFRHVSIVRPQPALDTLDKPALTAQSATAEQAPDADAAAIALQLKRLQNMLQTRTGEADALRAEIALLREALAEGEQSCHELKAKLAEKAVPPEQPRVGAETNADYYRKLLKAQQSRVAQRDERVASLEEQLQIAAGRIEKQKDKHRSWRERIKPLAEQFRQQRMIIRELREELRQRDLRQQQRREGRVPAAPAPQAAVANSDLQSLHGIGPALKSRLNEQGIYNVRQFAEMDTQSEHQLGTKLGLTPERMRKYNWVGQAREKMGMSATPPETAAAADIATA